MVRDLDLLKKITIKEFDTFADHRAFAASGTDAIANSNLFNLKGIHIFCINDNLVNI